MKSSEHNIEITHFSAYSVLKRIVNLALVVAGLVVSVNLWLLNKEQAQTWYESQADQLGRSITMQAALQLALHSRPLNETQAILTPLMQDKHVLGVVLFDAKGRRIFSLGQQQSILRAHVSSEQVPLVFVEAIYRQQQLVGYLRLQLDPQQVMQHHQQYQYQLTQQIQLLMLLSAIAALIVTRAFYKWRMLARQKAS